MSIRVHTLASALVLTLLAPASVPAASLQDPARTPEVVVRLASDVATVGGGESFEVAVVLEVPSGCRIQWSNPGDIGMATQAKLKGPSGFVIEGPLYPGPTEFTTAEGMRCYGYSGDVALFFKVKAPRGATSGQARFNARVDWQLSGATAVLGKAEPALTLPLGDRNIASRDFDTQLLNTQRSLLPQRWKSIGREAQLDWSLSSEDTGEGAQVALTVSLPEAERLEFFPTLDSEMVLLAHEFARAEKTASLTLLFSWQTGGASSQPRARGVLRVERGLELVYYEVDEIGRLEPSGG